MDIRMEHGEISTHPVVLDMTLEMLSSVVNHGSTTCQTQEAKFHLHLLQFLCVPLAFCAAAYHESTTSTFRYIVREPEETEGRRAIP